jgi:phosphoglycolate phosphatase-like HAD superfamily hydrolase
MFVRILFRQTLVAMLLLCSFAVSAQTDPLPSWNEGPSKERILSFVAAVTTPDSKDFVPAPQRIATFDNDGTLWAEQPMYSQLLFAIDRVKELAPQHPEWQTREPFASILKGDLKTAFAGGEKSVFEVVVATHTGMTNDEFAGIVRNWLATAKHPTTHKPFTEMVYQPMLELLTYLRANDFKTFIVSGGTVDFMRVFTEQVYGIPPEQVIGSRFKLSYAVQDNKPVIMREPKLDFNDDKAGKPVGIAIGIGRRPIAAFGNSDGDLQMLQYTTQDQPGARLGMLVHHTDAEREWAYDRQSSFGHLDKAMDAAGPEGWTLIDMKTDWKTIYPAVSQ